MENNKNIKNLIISTLIFGSLFLINLVLNNVQGTTFNNFTLSIFLCYLIYLYIVSKQTILSFSFIIMYMFSNLFGVYSIEREVFFLPELAIYTYNAGALLLITFVHFLFIQTLLFMKVFAPFIRPVSIKRSYKFSEAKSISNYKIMDYIVNGTILLTLILLARLITKPAFLVGIDRFLYAEKYLGGIWDKLVVLLVTLIPVLMIPVINNKSKKAIIAILLIIFYLFWIGNKFGYYIIVAYIIALPFTFILSDKNMKKIIFGGAFLFLMLFLVITMQSKLIYNRTFSENISYINQRTAQQGQLWWKMYSQEKNESMKLEELKDETDTYFTLNDKNSLKYNHGIYKVMKKTTPENLVHTKIYVLHSRYSYSTEASVYYYFKQSGLIIYTIVSAMFYYFIILSLVKSILRFEILETLIFGRLFTLTNNAIFQTDFDKLFSISTIFLVVILVLSKLIKTRNSSNNQYL